MVLERHRSPEHRHDAVARELVDGAAEALHNDGAAARKIGHDFAQSLSPHGRGDVHRMHDIGEQDGDLFVLRRSGRLDRCAALATELGHRIGRRATGTTHLCRRGQSTATIPAGIHISMVSPLVNDVCHIAAPAFNLLGPRRIPQRETADPLIGDHSFTGPATGRLRDNPFNPWSEAN